jgi:hypothetical protein
MMADFILKDIRINILNLLDFIIFNMVYLGSYMVKDIFDFFDFKILDILIFPILRDFDFLFFHFFLNNF